MFKFICGFNATIWLLLFLSFLFGLDIYYENLCGACLLMSFVAVLIFWSYIKSISPKKNRLMSIAAVFGIISCTLYIVINLYQWILSGFICKYNVLYILPLILEITSFLMVIRFFRVFQKIVIVFLVVSCIIEMIVQLPFISSYELIWYQISLICPLIYSLSHGIFFISLLKLKSNREK